jgi:hypothetical protein
VRTWSIGTTTRIARESATLLTFADEVDARRGMTRPCASLRIRTPNRLDRGRLERISSAVGPRVALGTGRAPTSRRSTHADPACAMQSSRTSERKGGNDVRREVAVRKFLCPRCQGSGFMDEDVTLVGIAPILERPSGVNDDEWDLPLARREFDDETELREVPIFQVPKRLLVERLAREREESLGGLEVEATTVWVPPRKERASPSPSTPRRRPMWVLLTSMLLAVAVVAIGVKRNPSWIPRVERAIGARLTGTR